jgi:hypothetical protein
LTLQITLGALTVLSQKQFIINSLHVVNGALVLVTSLVLTLRAHSRRFAVSAAGTGSASASRSGTRPTYHGARTHEATAAVVVAWWRCRARAGRADPQRLAQPTSSR